MSFSPLPNYASVHVISDEGQNLQAFFRLTTSLDEEQRRLARQTSDRAEARKQKRVEEKALKAISGAERLRIELERMILEKSQFKQKDEKTDEANAALEQAMRVAEANENRGFVEEAYNRLTSSWKRWVKHEPASRIGVAVQELRQHLKLKSQASEATPGAYASSASGAGRSAASGSSCSSPSAALATSSTGSPRSSNGSVSEGKKPMSAAAAAAADAAAAKAKKQRKKKNAKAALGSFVSLSDDRKPSKSPPVDVKKLTVEVVEVAQGAGATNERLPASLIEAASADAARVLSGRSSGLSTPLTPEVSEEPELPLALTCPISFEPLTHAVVTSTGQTFNEDGILKHINNARNRGQKPFCPITGIEMAPVVFPVFAVRENVREWLDKHPSYNCRS